MSNRVLSGLLFGLVAATGCGGGGAGKIMTDTPVLPYEAPDTDELAGIDPDKEPEEPAEAPAPEPAPAPTPAPSPTPAAAPAPAVTPPTKAPAKPAKAVAAPKATKLVPGAEKPPAQNPQK